MNVEEILKTANKFELKKRTIIHLILISNKLGDAANNALKPFDVSVQQFNVLRILRGQNGEPANLCTINERMVTKMSNTTRLIDKLITKEFVDRVVCKENRRKIEIRITKKGEVALSSMDIAMKENEHEMLQNFSNQDLEQLNILFDKF